jgi:molecular chaperone DnaJ
MGRVRAQQGFFTLERTCPNCQGTGTVIKDPCQTCQGSGRQQEEKSLAVNIPPGVEDGTRIRLAGEGEAGLRGAPPGDLYIFISVQPHRMFERRGQDLFCEVPITFATAALGGEIDVPTIEGKRLKLSIPAGTQTGRQFRVRDKGMVELQGKRRGDMFVEVAVETPVNLTKRQQELLREFEGAGDAGSTHHPASTGFFAKMKELWDDLRD